MKVAVYMGFSLLVILLIFCAYTLLNAIYLQMAYWLILLLAVVIIADLFAISKCFFKYLDQNRDED